MRKLIFALCVFSSLPAFAIHDVGGGAGGGGSVADPLTLGTINVSTLNVTGNGGQNFGTQSGLITITDNGVHTLNDGSAGIKFVTPNTNGTATTAGFISGTIDGSSPGSEDGGFYLWTRKAGVIQKTAAIGGINQSEGLNLLNNGGTASYQIGGVTVLSKSGNDVQVIPAGISGTSYLMVGNGGTAQNYGIKFHGASNDGSIIWKQALNLFQAQNNWGSIGYIVTDDVIGSNAGKYNMAGTTITTTAPTIDTNDRIWTLNNGAASWKQAITDGARTTVFNDFLATSSSTYEAGSTVAVRGMFLDSSLSAGTSGYVYTSRGPGVSPQWLPGGAGGGVANPMTGNLNSGGFVLTNYGGEGWNVAPSSTSYNVGTGALAFNSTTTICQVSNLVVNATYTFQAYVRFSGGGSASAGVNYNFITPTGSTVSWTLGAPNNGSTTARLDQGADGSGVDNSQSISVYNSQTNNEHIFAGYLKTDATHTGNIQMNIVRQGSASTMFVDFAWLRVERVAP